MVDYPKGWDELQYVYFQERLPDLASRHGLVRAAERRTKRMSDWGLRGKLSPLSLDRYSTHTHWMLALDGWEI